MQLLDKHLTTILFCILEEDKILYRQFKSIIMSFLSTILTCMSKREEMYLYYLYNGMPYCNNTLPAAFFRYYILHFPDVRCLQELSPLI